MKTGIALIVDKDFRVTENCEICKQRIGDYDFLIEFEIQPKPGVIGYKHVACAKKAEAIFQQERERGKA